MTSSNTHVINSLQTFASSFITQYQNKHNQLPTVEFDADWLSPCEQGRVNENESLWKPIEITEALSFDNVEKALGFSIHSDIKAYFTCLYSESLEAECKEGKLSLLLPWNKDDFERLQQNLIGHIMMKQKLKQNITLFFAVTDEDDMILSIDNQTGEIWVEQVGCVPHKKLSDSLTEFLTSLTPVV